MDWESAAVALAVGLLIGSERERSSHSGEPGVRTFALGALAGCFAAMVHPAALAVAVAGAALLATASYLRSDVQDAGTTTEVAFVLTVVIGGLAVPHPTIAAAAGVVAAVILLSKERAEPADTADRAGPARAAGPQENGEQFQDRPFAFKPALILAAALTALLVISKLAADWFGSAGVIVAIALAGLADAHAGALTAATLSAGGSFTPHTAAVAALAAIAVNTVVKVVLAFAAGGRRVGTSFALALIVPTAVTAGTMAFTLL